MNEEITYQVLQACISCGTKEFVVCPGSRNSSFVEGLQCESQLTTYYWPEERSAAFFALGRSKRTQRPVAVITTSGTAAAELLPAAMEAFYSGVPLILITADRPQNFRGSGAPQSAEQVGLYGHYVQFCLDVPEQVPDQLKKWSRKSPVHLNVCLDEPQKQPKFKERKLVLDEVFASEPALEHNSKKPLEMLNHFLEQVHYPLAIVSTLPAKSHESVAQLLLKLNIPVLLEGISGLREDPRLQSISIQRTEKILETAHSSGYPVDGILRIGGIPTHRIWRDLEYLEGKVKVCGLSELPFSGLSWTRCVEQGPLDLMLQHYSPQEHFKRKSADKWLAKEQAFAFLLKELFKEEPEAEPSLIYTLSQAIPSDAQVYLGNSLPIREWDMAAVKEDKKWRVYANRGVNGIDGQISTFLGLSVPHKENWGIFGDLTTLYDMAAFWVLPQLQKMSLKIVVINNGGGKIFERMYSFRLMLNEHQLSFQPLANMWNMDYTCIRNFQDFINTPVRQLIEIQPNAAATSRFWTKYMALDHHLQASIIKAPALVE